MRQPTDRQLEFLAAVERLTAEKQYPPTIAELAADLGLRSTATVQAHVAALVRKGLVAHDPLRRRTLGRAVRADPFSDKGVNTKRGNRSCCPGCSRNEFPRVRPDQGPKMMSAARAAAWRCIPGTTCW